MVEECALREGASNQWDVPVDFVGIIFEDGGDGGKDGEEGKEEGEERQKRRCSSAHCDGGGAAESDWRLLGRAQRCCELEVGASSWRSTWCYASR